MTQGTYHFTIWGRGVSCALAYKGRSVHWQGDEAAELVDRVEAGGPSVLAEIWNEYESVAQSDDDSEGD